MKALNDEDREQFVRVLKSVGSIMEELDSLPYLPENALGLAGMEASLQGMQETISAVLESVSRARDAIIAICVQAEINARTAEGMTVPAFDELEKDGIEWQTLAGAWLARMQEQMEAEEADIVKAELQAMKAEGKRVPDFTKLDRGSQEWITLLDAGIKRQAKPEKEEGNALVAPLPNGVAMQQFYRGLTTLINNRTPIERTGEKVRTAANRNRQQTSFTHESTTTGDIITWKLSDMNIFQARSDGPCIKIMVYVLQKMAEQYFPTAVTFTLKSMVETGLYSSEGNARRAIKDFYEKQKTITLYGKVTVGKKTVSEVGAQLFYQFEIDNGVVRLFFNPNLPREFIAGSYTSFPQFAYKLGSGAFVLVQYIFYRARMESSRIAKGGTFRISLDIAREIMGLPDPEDVKNRVYKNLIRKPITGAVNEINEAVAEIDTDKRTILKLSIVAKERPITEWLKGYIEVKMAGPFAESFIKLDEKNQKREKEIIARRRRRAAEKRKKEEEKKRESQAKEAGSTENKEKGE